MQADPDQGAFLDTLSWLLCVDDQLEEAQRHSSQAVIRLPTEPSVCYHLAHFLATRGQTASARNHLRLALLHPQPFPERARTEALLAEP